MQINHLISLVESSCTAIHAQSDGRKDINAKKEEFIKKISDANVSFEVNKKFDTYFKGKKVGSFSCNFFIDNQLIVEFKSFSSKVPAIFVGLVRSYVASANLKHGLLVNFGYSGIQIEHFNLTESEESSS